MNIPSKLLSLFTNAEYIISLSGNEWSIYSPFLYLGFICDDPYYLPFCHYLKTLTTDNHTTIFPHGLVTSPTVSGDSSDPSEVKPAPTNGN
jgi:hypothetical protein